MMKRGTIILAIMALVLLAGSPTQAAAAIAKVSSFKGYVIVQSGAEVNMVTRTGYLLNNGDSLLTKNGEAQITFNDGAQMKINPFSYVKIQEREETSGAWFFKSTKSTRRLTAYVGKLWFKSGASDRRNILQSPTAVCGIRGSDGDFGFDPVKMETYLNMYSGEADVIGNVVRGFFDNPGISAAEKSAVWNSLVNAFNEAEKARATGSAADQAQARVLALEAARQAANALLNNPDPTVREQARQAIVEIDASIAQLKADYPTITTATTTIAPTTTTTIVPPTTTSVTTSTTTTVGPTTTVAPTTTVTPTTTSATTSSTTTVAPTSTSSTTSTTSQATTTIASP